MKKIITLAIISIFSAYNIQAQAPNWAWAHNAGGAPDESGQSVTTDINGDVYVTGFFRSAIIHFGTVTLVNHDTSGLTDDIFIVKYDSSGGVIWAKCYGGAANDEGTSVATDYLGNVFLAANFSSLSLSVGFVSLTNFNTDSTTLTYDTFIAKLNQSGNVQWAKSFGNIGEENTNGISVDAPGDIYFTGSFSSDTVAFDTTKLVSNGSLDVFLAKLNFFGDVIWAKNAVGSDEDKALSVATDSIGNAVITGNFYSNQLSFDTIVLTKMDDTIGYTNDIFIAKYNSNGNVIWAKSAGGRNLYADDVSSNAIAMDKKGNSYITGYFRYDTVYFDSLMLNSTIESRDVFIAKYDTSGNAVWAKRAGDVLDDEARGIAVDRQGSIFITGDYSFGTIIFDNDTLIGTNFDTELFIVKLDSAGSVIWAKSSGGINGDFANSIAVFDINNVYVTGQYYSSSINFDAVALSNNGGADIFVARLYPLTVGIQNYSVINTDLIIYPNPAAQYATISYSLKSSTSVKLEIYNELGAKVSEVVNNEHQAAGDYNYIFSATQSGIYFVKLQTEEGVLTKRLVYIK